MRIDRVEAIPFAIPYTKPVVFATGSLDSAQHVLLRLVDTDGATGIAEVIPRPMIYGETVGGVLSVIDTVIRPLLCGTEIGPGNQLRELLANLVGNNTLKGALDIALWDLAAHRANQPCWRLLGGDGTHEVELTAILGLGTPDEVVADAAELVRRHGFRSFKVKVGVDLPRDIAACSALRAAFPGALIYVDANHGFTTQRALAFRAGTADLGLAWIEEPVDAAGAIGRRRVVAGGPPVLADESAPDAAAAAREVIEGRADMLSIKVARTGFTESARVLAVGEALGADLVLGSQGDSELGTLAALQFAAVSPVLRTHPAEVSYFATTLAGSLLTQPLRIADGRIVMPDAPGLGGTIDEEALRRYAS